MTVTLEWHGDEVERDLNRGLELGLRKATGHLVAKVKEKLNRQGLSALSAKQGEVKRPDKTIAAEVAAFRKLVVRDGTGRISAVTLPTGKRGKPLKLSSETRRRLRIAQELETIGDVDPPGGVPRKRSGQLARSIAGERVGKLHYQAGSTMPYKTGYAAIHEHGGEINHPGGTPYIIIGGRFIPLSKNHRLASKAKKTKPHKIKIPARPFMRPTFNREAQVMTDLLTAEAQAALRGDTK